MKDSGDTIALAHRVHAHEDFDNTARMLLRLLQDAQRQFPGVKRNLILEIDGYRNANGTFDNDMFEPQSKFMAEFLIQFLTHAVTPLAGLENPGPQNNSIPETLNLIRLDSHGPSTGNEGTPPKPRF